MTAATDLGRSVATWSATAGLAYLTVGIGLAVVTRRYVREYAATDRTIYLTAMALLIVKWPVVAGGAVMDGRARRRRRRNHLPAVVDLGREDGHDGR